MSESVSWVSTSQMNVESYYANQVSEQFSIGVELLW